jgi:hypothetical protein
MVKTAILGWGSLLWDRSQGAFEEQHKDWRLDGPALRLEFSRISRSRLDALTLVIDPVPGEECQVAYALSRRGSPEEAISDLCAREKTREHFIGCASANGSRRHGRDERSVDAIVQWAKDRSIDVVLWTDLPGSFEGVSKQDFLSIAVNHLQGLPLESKATAAEYVWRAPVFVINPLPKALQVEPWFQEF